MGTRAARALPREFVDIKHDFLLRVYWIVDKFSIPKDLFLNMDETGVLFFPMPKRTWGPKGAKQVDIVRLDEKRQFTLSPVISASGEVAGRVQVIWEGKTRACCPSVGTQKRHEAELLHTNSISHWSTASTVFELIENLWTDYVLPKMEKSKLNVRTQHWVLLMEVYSSHRDECLLRDNTEPWKVWFARFAQEWVVKIVCEQFERNVSTVDIVIPHKKSELTDPFCAWVATATSGMRSKTSVIERAWEETGVLGAWDTSSSTFTHMKLSAYARSDSGELWAAHGSRSKQGKLARTRLTGDGKALEGKYNLGDGDDSEEDFFAEDPAEYQLCVLDTVDENSETGDESHSSDTELPASLAEALRRESQRGRQRKATDLSKRYLE